MLGRSRNHGAKPVLSGDILRFSCQAPDKYIHFPEIRGLFYIGVLVFAISNGDDGADDLDLVIPFGRDLDIAILRVELEQSLGDVRGPIIRDL